MPLTWTIDHKKRLISAVADGDVTRPEFEAFLDAMDGEGAMPFRKLFDGVQGDTRMAPAEILEVGVRIRGYHLTGVKMGPLAIVLTPDKQALVERVIGILATADRPMKVFTSAAVARRWINRVELARPARKKSGRKPGRPPKQREPG